MPQKLFRFGIFWKLLLVLWLSMVLSVLAAIVYLRISMGPMAAPPPELMTLGLIPLAPLVTGSLAMLGVGVAVAWYLAWPKPGVGVPRPSWVSWYCRPLG